MRLTAEARAKSGRFREAEALYRELLELDPGDRESQAALVDLYEDQDRLDEALALLQEMEKRDPENAAIGERITLDFARAGRFGEAEKRARDQASRAPGEPIDPPPSRLRSLREGGRRRRREDPAGSRQDRPGRRAARRALAGELLQRAALRAKRGRFSKRACAARERIPRTPPTGSGRRSSSPISSIFRRTTRRPKKVLEPAAVSGSAVNPRAVRILLLIARDTEDYAYGLARGQSRRRRGQGERRVDRRGRRVSVPVRGPQGRRRKRSIASAASKEVERALAAADVYARLKDYASAARVAREAVKRFPESPEALFRLGSSLERAGNSAEAEKVFSKLLEMRPNDSAAQNYLGYMWADRGENLREGPRPARESRRPRAAQRRLPGLARLGLLPDGKLDAAQVNLLEAHRREPDDPTIEEHLGDLSERQGNVARAVTHWERALTL